MRLNPSFKFVPRNAYKIGLKQKLHVQSKTNTSTDETTEFNLNSTFSSSLAATVVQKTKTGVQPIKNPVVASINVMTSLFFSERLSPFVSEQTVLVK